MTRVKQAFAALSVALGLTAPSVGMAQDAGWYAGASIGQSKYDGFCTNLNPGVSCEDTDTALRVFGGFRINRHFAVELGYHQLGEATATAPSGSTLGFEATTFELLGLGIVPLGDRFSVYGKVGLYAGDTKVSANGFSTSPSRNDLTYGIGAQYDFTPNLGVRAEWQRYQDLGSFDLMGVNLFEGDVDVMSIGLVYRFR
jgi:OmpA-OmpF porin, OOP family